MKNISKILCLLIIILLYFFTSSIILCKSVNEHEGQISNEKMKGYFTTIGKRILYTDRDKNYIIQPPQGWEIIEFDETHSKVEFYIPSGYGDNRDASLIILVQSVYINYPTGNFDLYSESWNWVERFKKMGDKTAKYEIFDFCGVNAAKLFTTIPGYNARQYALSFRKYDRIFAVSFTSPTKKYEKYFAWRYPANEIHTRIRINK